MAGSAYLRLRRLVQRHVRARLRAVFGRRIPIVMVTGSVGKTTTTRMVARILEVAGHSVGVGTTDGIVISGRWVEIRDASGYSGAGRVLRDPQITAAVLETARGHLIKRGLYVTRCSVAALLNVRNIHIGTDGINSIEEMGDLKRRVTDGARECAVLAADDPYCRKLSHRYPPQRTCYFTLGPENPFISAHLARGGKAVVLEERDGEDWIVWRDADSGEPLLKTSDLPSTHGGIARHNIANAMAAAGLAKGLRVESAAIRAGLSGFACSTADNLNRFNVLDGYPFKLIVDRARTVPAARAMVEAQKRIPVSGKRICLLTSVGNRPDHYFDEVAAEFAPAFDLFIVYEDEAYRRGRAVGERNLLMTRGLLKSGVTSRRVLTARDYEGAVRLLAANAEPGDLVLFLGADLRRVAPILSRIFGERGTALPVALAAAGTMAPQDGLEAPAVAEH